MLRRKRLDAPGRDRRALLALLAIGRRSAISSSTIGEPADAADPADWSPALLVANLVPAMALMVLVARRLAMRRAAQSPIGGEGRLHVRLVALFSIIASVPTLLVVIFASMLFQSGVKFWFSDRARGMLENAGDRAGRITTTSSTG